MGSIITGTSLYNSLITVAGQVNKVVVLVQIEDAKA